MRLLWVLVFVGVAGGVTSEEGPAFLSMKEEVSSEFKNTAQEEWPSVRNGRKSCLGEKDRKLCRKGFFFTSTALTKVGMDGDCEVVLTLEESLHPHVSFNISLRYLGDKVMDAYPNEEELEEATILATEEVTLEVNELRRVVLRVSDLTWKTAFLVVKAHPTGHPQINKHNLSTRIVNKAFSDVEVFVQADKSAYAPGDTVDYRALVVEGNVDKTPKFAQVILILVLQRFKEIQLPWVEVPENGILRGNFTLVDHTIVAVRVSSDVTSSDFYVATTPILEQREESRPSEWMSVRMEVQRNVSFSQPRVKGRVTLTSTGGIPLHGNCNVTIDRDSGEGGTKFTRKIGERRVTVGVAGEEFEFDVREELGAMREEVDEQIKLNMKAKCSDVHSGSVGNATETIYFYKSLFRVDLLSWETLPKGNSCHTQTTVVLQFLVERRDGGSVEEEPLKGLHVALLLSEENLGRLRPSATNFSLPIPPNGRVRLEFQVNKTPTFRWEDRIRMEVGDAAEEASLDGSPVDLKDTIHVTPIDPAQLIRRGDVVRFRVRSCVHYASLNAILSSASAIYSSRRFSFSPQRGWLDEVIELTIPRNATKGSLTLTVYGGNNHEYVRFGNTASVVVNLVPSSGPQEIFVVDQVDVDMSTLVTFRLEGMLADSVVSLQAAKLDSPEVKADEGEETERPLRCYEKGYLIEREGQETKIQNDSPDAVEPDDVDISANFRINDKYSNTPRRSLTFIDVDRKTSKEDNGTLTVTKTFDRLKQFGTYVVSGATFNSKSGRNVFSNSPVLRILPPPVKLSILVPPSIILGETVEVIGYVKNNLANPFEGHVTMESSGGGSTEVREELVEIEPNSYKFLKMQVTPMKIGELIVSLRSNISSRLTATKKLKVNPSN